MHRGLIWHPLSVRDGLALAVFATWSITPVLTKLHWLPVHKRVMFKTAVLVWKCLNSTAPGYLSKLCIPVASASGRQHLRSASTGLLQVPRAWTTIGRRSFAVAGPSLWNSLPAALWRPEMTLHTFKRQLKAYLFHMCWWTEGTITTARRCCGVFVIVAPDTQLHTYLLTYRESISLSQRALRRMALKINVKCHKNVILSRFTTTHISTKLHQVPIIALKFFYGQRDWHTYGHIQKDRYL